MGHVTTEPTGTTMAKHIEKIARAAESLFKGKAASGDLARAIGAIAKRSADHEREMDRVKGDMARGARAGKGRFRI